MNRVNKTKQILRQQLWEALDKAGQLFAPRPVWGRLPTFLGEEFALNRLTTLEAFETANVVKVDAAKREATTRELLLRLGKTLALTRMDRSDAFYQLLASRDIPFHYTALDATEREAADAFARLIPLAEPVSIDLVLLPSLAVDPETGARIGVGNGSNGMGSDLEIGVLRALGAIGPSTQFITLVHPLQLCTIDPELMESFDVSVDVVVTPWKVYDTQRVLPQPAGIDWSQLREAHFRDVACLKAIQSHSN